VLQLTGEPKRKVAVLKEKNQVIHSLLLLVITKLRDKVQVKLKNKVKNHFSNLKVTINW